jgi:hypothetical protein
MTGHAHAQDNSGAVEALFSEGKRLAGENKFAEACPKFLASYNLEHRLGTLLNLADCYEKNRQLASAWARFVEARTLAQRSNQIERAEYASQHAADLEPKLSKLTIQPKSPKAVQLNLDGSPVDPGEYGVAIAVDAGKHTLEATAPDKKPWRAEIVVAPNADHKVVDVPDLLDAPKPPPTEVASDQAHRGMSGRAVAGLVVAGVGIAGVAVGVTFGALALSKNSSSDSYCNVGGVKDACYAQGVSLRSDAVTFGNVSTAFLIVGGAAIATGAVIFITAPSSGARARVGFDGHRVFVGGEF